jgi:hypothetical protein
VKSASPLAGVFCGVPLAETSIQFTSVHCQDKGLYTDRFSASWVRVLLCEGLGICLPLLGLCFLPVALVLGGKKVPSLFGIKIHYRSMN